MCVCVFSRDTDLELIALCRGLGGRRQLASAKGMEIHLNC